MARCSPKLPLPIFLPMRYLPPTRRSMLGAKKGWWKNQSARPRRASVARAPARVDRRLRGGRTLTVRGERAGAARRRGQQKCLGARRGRARSRARGEAHLDERRARGVGAGRLGWQEFESNGHAGGTARAHAREATGAGDGRDEEESAMKS